LQAKSHGSSAGISFIQEDNIRRDFLRQSDGFGFTLIEVCP
jgi:hypothetical protein